MRPLTVTSRDGKIKEIPLRDPTPLMVLAYMRGSNAVDSTPYLLSFLGELGACTPRRSEEDPRDYAARVAEGLSWVKLGDLVVAADRVWVEAVNSCSAEIVPTQKESEEMGKSLRATTGTPSSPASEPPVSGE